MAKDFKKAKYRRATEESCTRKAAALCKKLGKGWKPRVWENLGWHWEVQKGNLWVRTDRDYWSGVYTYSAWLQTSPQIITEHFATPGDAIRQLHKMITDRINELGKPQRVLDMLLQVE